MELRQIRAETKRLYTMHQNGVLDTRCLAQLEWTRRLEVRCPPLHSTLVKRWDTFHTLLMLNSKMDPNRASPAWLIGSGFPLPLCLKKPQWRLLFDIGRPGVRIQSSDYAVSERATQNHMEVDKQYWISRFRSLDAAPVAYGPVVGLGRHPGQNGGRYGIEYSGLGIGLHYVQPELW